MERTWTLSKVTYEFYQEGNTDGTTSECEELNVEIQSCTGCLTKEGGYFVLRTPTGWSVNDIDELQDIFNFVKQSLNIPEE